MQPVRYSYLVALVFIVFSDNAQSAENRHFTPEEVLKLKQLRQLIGNKLTKEYMKMDGYLIRWLEVKKFNVAQANEALQIALKWRAENKVDGILNEEVIPELARHPYYTISNEALTKDGSAFGFVDAKKYDVRKFAVAGQAKEFMRELIQMYEKFEERIYAAQNETGKNIGYAMIISDLMDYNLKQHGCVRCIPIHLETATMYDKYYPLLFNPVFMINAPRIFSPLFELVKPLLSPAIVKTLHVYGPIKSEWEPKLLEHLAPETIPVRLGGTAPSS